MLCKYKDIFGKPREGVHKYRFYGFAIVDVLMTVLVALIVSMIIKKSFDFYHFIIVLILFFISGIILHRAFCVDTKLDSILRSHIY
jgi:hypothetical protein